MHAERLLMKNAPKTDQSRAHMPRLHPIADPGESIFPDDAAVINYVESNSAPPLKSVAHNVPITQCKSCKNTHSPVSLPPLISSSPQDRPLARTLQDHHRITAAYLG